MSGINHVVFPPKDAIQQSKWFGSIEGMMHAHGVLSFFFSMDQLMVPGRFPPTVVEHYIIGDPPALRHPVAEPEIDVSNEANRVKTKINHDRFAKDMLAAQNITAFLRNGLTIPAEILESLSVDGDNIMMISGQELYQRLHTRYGTPITASIPQISEQANYLDKTLSIKVNLARRDSALTILARVNRPVADADKRDRLIQSLEHTSFRPTIDTWQQTTPDPARQTYASLCAELIRAEDSGRVTLTAHQVLHGTAMAASAAPMDPAMAQMAKELNDLKRVVTQFLQGGKQPARGGVSISKERKPIPATAPDKFPNWCATHKWNASHTTDECKNPGALHAHRWGPIELEKHMAAEFAARKSGGSA